MRQPSDRRRPLGRGKEALRHARHTPSVDGEVEMPGESESGKARWSRTALSVLAPLMLYSGFEMSESLAYPLCLVALWTMLRAVRRPSLRNDALLLAAIVLASAARLQLVVLIPAALTAVLLVALARTEPA